jgi:phospholipid/cholesterol/gamma-HCH transport system permease protein
MITSNASPLNEQPATIHWRSERAVALTGHWTSESIGSLPYAMPRQRMAGDETLVIDANGIDALDTAGAWVLQSLVQKLRKSGQVRLEGLRPQFTRLLDVVAKRVADQTTTANTATPSSASITERVGRGVVLAAQEGLALVGFIGETAIALAGSIAQPKRIRWRPILFHIRSAGLDALPIVGLLSLMLGIVVAYQGADQLRQYGANIFVADLVGLSMLREFAPLITAIIIAGRSGSAYAAQIGTMAVTEEIDAMRTLGIPPIEMLVLPKILALVIALPLLTVAADVLGVLGGMMMARSALDVGFPEFIGRFLKAVSTTTYMVGIGKAPVFAAIIAMVGCFQGFRTQGGADSVGRQTTRAVVQSIVLVIVADGVFSIAFSALDL